MNSAPISAQFVQKGVSPLRLELKAAKSFLVDHALPFWSQEGFDPASGLFQERCDFQGVPIRQGPIRLMLQCRQIYVFSHATLLGWLDGRGLVRQAVDALLTRFQGSDPSTPYVFSVARDGAVADPRQDAYGYAFFLFAISWARRLLGAEINSSISDDLLTHFDSVLANPHGGGYVSDMPRTDRYLRQNPHMHLFEAALEVEDAFGSERARAMSDKLFHLFKDDIFLTAERALPEFHDEQWRPVDSPVAIFEPGHHFEWIWLLDRYGARTGTDVEELVALLGQRAYTEGVDTFGAAVEAVEIRSRRRTETRRCWGTCEGLKAAASDFERGRWPELSEQRAAAFLRALRTLFLGKPFAHGWVDRVDAAGDPLVDYVPASTLYHIMLAVAEARRVFG